MTNETSAWAGFWRDEQAAREGATLVNLHPDLRKSLDAPWRSFAVGLPASAQVLDLATGGGIVLSLLRRERTDLILTGVDAAADLPTKPGMTLRGGVLNDRLPFPDASFDAVTSRFGIEYGPLQPSATEAMRVLRPRGTLCMLAHHADSRVLSHNRARRDALRWAAYESGWVERALNLTRTRQVMALATPPAFRSATADARLQFPEQSVAAEFLTGLVQILDLAHPQRSEGMIRQLLARADGEIARLDALLAAACDGDRLRQLTQGLEQAGMNLAPVGTVDEADGVPLAWHLEGHKI